jgi:hypothetical protein
LFHLWRHNEPKQWEVTPGVTACRLNIQLGIAGIGCTAYVTYTHTRLGPAGNDLVAAFTVEHYQKLIQGWEDALNHFLTTGTLLGDDPMA